MRSRRLVAGCDEAGRGPVVGDMFVAMVVLPEDSLPELHTAGVRDSKRLSPGRREELLPTILSAAEVVAVARVPPSSIDSGNLNRLFTDAVCRLARRIVSLGYTPSVLYVDAAGREDVVSYRISRCLPPEVRVVAEHEADSRYIPVAAASIVAKVLRDWHIESLKRLYGDMGSGYPSDPRTRAWLESYLREHGELPPIVRRSWATVRRLLGEKGRRTLLDYLGGRS